MGKNLNTQIWHLDSSGYTQTVRDLFTTTPPVYTHAQPIDNSFNFCVNGIDEQKKRAVLHMTNRSDVTYTTENIDNIFIGNWIYDNRGNYTNRINRVFGNGTGGVSNFAIAPNSGSQPSGGNFKILCNFNYLTAVWAPRIGFAAKTAIGTVTYYKLKELDNESTAEDAEEGETWWAYYTRKSNDYFVSIDCYNEQQYTVAGSFSSTSIYEGEIRAGIPLSSRVSWLKQPYYYGYSYGTDGCLIYNDNGQGRYADLTFDVIFSYSLDYMEKKDEYDDIWKDSYNNPYDRHNILYGLRISKDIIMHIICSYGLPFSFSDATNISIGHADYALPEVKNNTTTGNYFRGADAITADTDNNRWANTKDIDNKPAGGGGGSDGDKIDDMNVNPLWAMSSDAGFARYFLMSNDQIGSLQSWLSDTTFPDGYDPYPYIISLIQFPLKLSPDYCMPRTPAGHVIIGGEDTGITASLIANEKAWKGLGTYDVPRENGNFLDYSPYSQYEVYIPCCGWVTCPDIIAGRKIAVKVNYDLTTAAIIGNVYVTIDGKEMIVASKSGMMGRETIVSGDAAGVRSAQITSALLSAGTGALNVATGAMSGNAVAAVSGGYHVVAGLAQANIAANSSYARTVGSTGGRALLCQYDKCYLKICTTDADIPEGYGHTVGYICNKSGKVSDFRGFTVFDNFDVTGITGLTQRELMEVKRIMESGVYINSPPE